MVALPVGEDAPGGLRGIAGGARHPNEGEVAVAEAIRVGDARGIGRQCFADAGRARDGDLSGGGCVRALCFGPVLRRRGDQDDSEEGQHQHGEAPSGALLHRVTCASARTADIVDLHLDQGCSSLCLAHAHDAQQQRRERGGQRQQQGRQTRGQPSAFGRSILAHQLLRPYASPKDLGDLAHMILMILLPTAAPA